jgi:hypothetical protein
LHIAAENGHADVVKMILQDERFIGINMKNKVKSIRIILDIMLILPQVRVDCFQ